SRLMVPRRERLRKSEFANSVWVKTLLANSEAAVWMAMLGNKSHSEPRYLTGFRASSGLIVDFANSVIIGTQLYGSFSSLMRAALSDKSMHLPLLSWRCTVWNRT